MRQQRPPAIPRINRAFGSMSRLANTRKETGMRRLLACLIDETKREHCGNSGVREIMGTTTRAFTASIVSCLIALVLTAVLGSLAYALTIEQEVPPDYVREHPEQWSVKVAKKENGLIQFTIVRTLSEPKYLVAHLAVHHAGKLIATSDTPLFGKKHDNTVGIFSDNTFYFSISAEDLAESKFEIGESHLMTVDGVQEDQPVIGSTIHQFRLLDFVPEDMLKSGSRG
jgi:hypothetical protein